MKALVVLCFLGVIGSKIAAARNSGLPTALRNKTSTVFSENKFLRSAKRYSKLQQLFGAIGLGILTCTASICAHAADLRPLVKQQRTDQHSDGYFKKQIREDFAWYGLKSEAYGGSVYGVDKYGWPDYLQLHSKAALTADNYHRVLVHYRHRNRSYVGVVVDTRQDTTIKSSKLLVRHSLTIDDGADQLERTIDVSDISGVYEIYPYNDLDLYRHEWVSFTDDVGRSFYGWVSRQFSDSYHQIKVTSFVEEGKLVALSEPFYETLASFNIDFSPDILNTVGARESGDSLLQPTDTATVERHVLEKLLLARVRMGSHFREIRRLVSYGARNLDAGMLLAAERGAHEMVSILASLGATDFTGALVKAYEREIETTDKWETLRVEETIELMQTLALRKRSSTRLEPKGFFTPYDKLAVDQELLEEGLLLAAEQGDVEMIRLIAQAGAKDLSNALRHAAANGYFQSVKELVKFGARNYGEALEYAHDAANGATVWNDLEETIELLRQLEHEHLDPSNLDTH